MSDAPFLPATAVATAGLEMSIRRGTPSPASAARWSSRSHAIAVWLVAELAREQSAAPNPAATVSAPIHLDPPACEATPLDAAPAPAPETNPETAPETAVPTAPAAPSP